QYPSVTPPTVQVSAVYPGANAETIAQTVGGPIEEAVNGVEGMLYMSSTSTNNGTYGLTVTFEVGTDIDLAAVRVQNLVATAEPRLPEEVKRQGVSTAKRSTSLTLVVNFISPDKSRDVKFLSNTVALTIADQLKRIEGVGEVRLAGAQIFSMRVWLDPGKLQARSLTTNDVLGAIREQNVQVAAGAIGTPPANDGQVNQLSITTRGRLSEPEEFGQIILKINEEGQAVYLRDVARIEMGAEDYSTYSRLGGQPTVSVIIYQSPDANALDVKKGILATLEEARKGFPKGFDYNIAYDTTLFVEAAIEEVVVTLFIAVLLVFLTILVFLQDFRASLIPAITIPVSLIATFMVMSSLGFSLNMITLFGLVLAIGIVVDDAIVVVENVKRRIVDDGVSSKTAAVLAMREVTGPVIATTLVLLAVFVPTAFLGGITGELYRQFALTISVATVFSSLNALTLSPALAGVFLRSSEPNRVSRAFNSVFAKITARYTWLVGAMVKRTLLSFLVFLILVGTTVWLFSIIPTSFLPAEDQGYIIIAGQLPDSASLERSGAVSAEIEKTALGMPGVKNIVTIVGLSLFDGANTPNSFTSFIILEPWARRKTPDRSLFAILGQLNQSFSQIPEAQIFAIPPPAIQGLGVSGGFALELRDRGGVGLVELEKALQGFIEESNGQPTLTGVRSTYRAQVPRLLAKIDRAKVKTLGLTMTELSSTLQTALGSTYVNDFNKFGQTYRVTVQADSQFRMKSKDIGQLKVRNSAGEMIPLSTVLEPEETVGPQIVKRFNQFPAASISGQSTAGVSSGEALNILEQIAQKSLPNSLDIAWSGVSYQEKQSSDTQTLFLFILAVVIVFLVLAAQYESWLAPIAIVLAVPLGFLGAALALLIRSYSNDIYVQIGFVLLIALASKNAILIVEFGRELCAGGIERRKAAVEAARLRFRPILMTSLAFVFGTFPLVIATGAGAGARRSLGTTVFGGMVAATFLTLIFVPVFFVIVQGWSDWKRKSNSDGVEDQGEPRETVEAALMVAAPGDDPKPAETTADDAETPATDSLAEDTENGDSKG
ncbi:MAG: multidrug efflux RND transporter permease subunit, partial [Planctomycetota bacterium]|nr:multidrug efflux RND transporter permease subunit [Planctomycetota bacterium]